MVGTVGGGTVLARACAAVVATALVATALVAALAPAASGSPSGDADTERFIVVVDHGDPAAVAADHRQAHDAEVDHVYRQALEGYAARMSEQAAERVRHDDRVAYVEADRRVTTAHHQCGHASPKERDDACADATVWGTVTDADTGSSVEGAEEVVNGDTPWDAALGPAVTAKASTSGGGPAVPWGVDRTGATQAHDAGHTGAGTDVYVIDTGIQADHADLEPNLGTGHAVVDCLGLGCEEDWGDDDGHGTHVAGTIGATDAGQIVGMAPDATLHAVKVLNALGAGSTSDVIAGIDWVAGQAEDDPGAVVANMSLGGSGERTGACTDTGFRGEDSYHEAVCAATHEGVVFTVAAGNSDEDAQASVPAAYHDTVLTASATDETDNFAGFSNWGDDAFAWALGLADQPTPQSAPVALAAPGVDVASTWNDGGTREASGTSMAAPHVGGGAALVASARGIGGDDRQAFLDVRAALMSEAEGTADFDDASSYDGQRQEGFLDMRFLAQ